MNGKKVVTIRDVITHRYFKVDFDLVWSIAETTVKELESAANEMSP